MYYSVLFGLFAASLLASVAYKNVVLSIVFHLLINTVSRVRPKPLECGLQSGEDNGSMKKIINSCLKIEDDLKTTTETSTEKNSEEDSNESTVVILKKAVNPRNSAERNLEELEDEDLMTKLTSKINTTNGENNCAMKCVFEKLGMVDSNGLPIHDKVSNGILRNAYQRELRDFLQDSIDVCFQMAKPVRTDPCGFSSQLMQCLAEKGRQNCADWPIGNIPFNN